MDEVVIPDWNATMAKLNAAARAARDAAKADRDARIRTADLQLKAEGGVPLVALLAQRDTAIADFIAQQERALEDFRQRWEAHIKASFATAYEHHQHAVATAEAIYHQDVAAAEAPIEAFKKDYAEKKEQQQKLRAARRRKQTVAGAREQREWQEHENRVRQAEQEAWRTGRFPSGWMHWWVGDAQLLGIDPAPYEIQYQQHADFREKWLAQYPEQRAMIESTDRALYDAWEEAHKHLPANTVVA